MFQIKGNLRSSVRVSSLAERDYSETYEIHSVQTLQKKIGCFNRVVTLVAGDSD